MQFKPNVLELLEIKNLKLNLKQYLKKSMIKINLKKNE